MTTTIDSLYGGKLQFKQNKAGYRFGVDSVLLATFAQSNCERTLDMGTGVGVVALQLWHERKSERVVGLEVQPQLAKMAQANLVLNDAEDACEIVVGDLREHKMLAGLGDFDRVIMNPPYLPAHAGRLPPSEEKAIAKHKLLGGLEEWLHAASRVLHPGGVLEVVYPSERLADLMSRAVAHGFGPTHLTLVHPRPKLEAQLALMRARKAGRSGLKVTVPWLIYNRNGKPHARYSALA
jgi:tRNA1(Val) A37 N6-methylase TrmN6